MTERVSERIWAAARAAFESRRVAHLVARIAELEGLVKDHAESARMLREDCERQQKRIAELEAERNIDLENDALSRRVDELEAALKPFAEYAERIKATDDADLGHLAGTIYDPRPRLPQDRMAWFIAARKAWRKEGEQ